MPLGMEVGLGPGDFVLPGDPLPLPKKGDRAPNFRPMFIVAKRLHASRCHLVWRCPGDFVLDGDPARPLNFRPMFIIVIVISLEHCTGVRRYWSVQVHV